MLLGGEKKNKNPPSETDFPIKFIEHEKGFWCWGSEVAGPVRVEAPLASSSEDENKTNKLKNPKQISEVTSFAGTSETPLLASDPRMDQLSPLKHLCSAQGAQVHPHGHSSSGSPLGLPTPETDPQAFLALMWHLESSAQAEPCCAGRSVYL